MNRGQRSYSIPNNIVALANGNCDGMVVQQPQQQPPQPQVNNDVGAGGDSAGDGEETEMPLLPRSKS